MARKIRIECEQRTRAGGTLTDLRSGKQAMFYRGEATSFELGIFANGRMLTKADLTNVKVRIRNGATLLSETIIAGSSLSSSLTAQQWRTGNAALLTVGFSAAATGDLPAGMLTLEVSGTVDGTSSIYASGTIESVTLEGLITGTPPTPGPPTSYSKAESDALYEPLGNIEAISDDVDGLKAFVEHTDETTPGGFLRVIDQTFTASQQKQARDNINAPVGGGLDTRTGREEFYDLGAGALLVAQTAPRGYDGALTVFTPSGNTDIRITAPDIPIGIVRMVKIQQGFQVHWSSHYTFPPNAITCGASAESGYAKKSWHPATGEGYEKFELIYDGSTTHVRRWRATTAPESSLDFVAESPFWDGTAWYDRCRAVQATTAGSPATATMTGSVFRGIGFNGTSQAANFSMHACIVAQGMTLAMVFTATNSTSQRILFASNAMGIQVVADSDGMRLQAFGASAGTGLLISTSYSTVPVTFVAVIRANSAGAYVLTTDPTGGGQTGSFTPTTPAAGYGRFASESGGFTKGLACIVSRAKIIRAGINPDQARALLDSLTEHYQIG